MLCVKSLPRLRRAASVKRSRIAVSYAPFVPCRSRASSSGQLHKLTPVMGSSKAHSEETLRLAEPQPAEEVQLSCWYMDDSNEDQRLPHKCDPNELASVSDIRKLGVVSWRLDADQHEKDSKLQAIRDVRNYTYQDVIEVCPDKLPGYEDKIKTFFEEHIHDDEEIRYILAGSDHRLQLCWQANSTRRVPRVSAGYFDVRDKSDRWIRIECRKGDMIVLPEGIYHRFTLDTNNYIKAMRLFVGDPVWTPINRDGEADSHPSRSKYLQAVAALG